MDKAELFRSGDYACELDFQEGWIDLTMPADSHMTPREFAQTKLGEFNLLHLSRRKQDLLDQMAKQAQAALDASASLCSVYYSESGTSLIELTLNCYGEEGVQPTLEGIKSLLLEANDSTVAGEPDVRHLDLPAGPAMRIQATYKEKGLFRFLRPLIEVVKYAVRPTVNDDVIVIQASWEKLQFSEELAKVVDELVPSLKLVAMHNGQKVD